MRRRRTTPAVCRRWALGVLCWVHRARGRAYVRSRLGEVTGLLDLPQRLPTLASLQERRRALPDESDHPLLRNVGVLGGALGLDATEQRILAFVIAADHERVLSQVLEPLDPLDDHSFRLLLADVLDEEPDAVAAALRPDGSLNALRLIERADTVWTELPVKASDPLAVLLEEHETPEALMGRFFRLAPGTDLGAGDYPHLATEVALAEALLRGAIRARACGLHVLMHGPPGTGKTELARVLAARVGAPLHEVRIDDDEGAEITRGGRLASFLLCQRLLARSPAALVVLDEAEDVLSPEDRTALRAGSKGWITRTLETVPVPTIWIANDVSRVDPAVLRRFDLLIEVGPPPRTVRRGMVDRYAGSLDAATRAVLAEDPRIAPAHLARAARVADLVGSADVFETALRPHLDVVGPRPAVAPVAAEYDPALSNAAVDLRELSGALARAGRGRVCLHGPPGTGKTEWARYVAELADLPLLHRTASDLLSCWVGETEKHLARMFEDARREGGVLLLDEADSFLRSREAARQSWEVTQVNELLVQMERFDGIFLCATNLVETLDAAAARRFDVKIRFDPLRADQARELFLRTARRLGLDGTDLADAAAHLPEVTPGTFDTAVRRLRLTCPQPSARALLDALRDELAFEGASRLGF